MPSIFPDQSAGGLIVRDPDTGLPVAQPNVENPVAPPLPFGSTCDVTALPDDCGVRIPNSQMNAVVAELVNFFVAMAPGRVWDCSALDNMSEAFEEFVAELAGQIGGSLSCSVAESDGGEAEASILYCDGTTIRKWLIRGDDSLMVKIQEELCAGPTSYPNTADDYMIYCRNGEIRTTQAITFQLYTGEWLQAREYPSTNYLVRRNGRLYSPNAAIPAGTEFVIGTIGATWYEVSPSGGTLPYDQTQQYLKDTIVLNNGQYYAANDTIPANTPFVVGETGQTWRLVILNQCYINDFSADLTYGKNSVVVIGGLLYRAKQTIAPGAFNAANWDVVGGEKNIYRGPWLLASAYSKDDAVEHAGNIYAANDVIPTNTAFVIGVAGATWRELSPSLGVTYDTTKTYTIDEIVSYIGTFYAANGDIPINTPPTGGNIGSSGSTWRLVNLATNLILRQFAEDQTYVDRELFEYQGSIYRTLGGKPVGPFDATKAYIVGERDKYRSDWAIAQAYKNGDLVINLNYTAYGYGTLYRANSDIAAGAGFVVVTDGSANAWTMVNPKGAIYATYDVTKPVNSGDNVLTPWGVYQANDDIPAFTAFTVGNSGLTFKSMGRSRPSFLLSLIPNLSTSDHADGYLIFDNAAAKTYQVDPDQFNDGDVIAGVNIGAGQLSFVEGAGVTIITPDTLSLRNKVGVSFMLKCIGSETFVLSGDLQTV
jgi:hypothetical protein